MKKLFLLLICIYPFFSFGQNFDFATATEINAGTSVSGAIGNQPLYYKTLLPAPGSVKIIVSGNNTSAGVGYLKLEVFDSRQSGMLLSKNIQKTDVAPGEEIKDTLIIPCRDIETIFFKFSTNGGFSFNLAYEMEEAYESDPEDNNTAETAAPFKLDSIYHGAIGYTRAGVVDNADFYKIAGLKGGSFSVFLEGVNTGDTEGRIELEFYQLIDGNYMSLEQRKVIETGAAAPGQRVKDSIILDCLYMYDGIVYLKVVSNTCFSYSLLMNHNEIKVNADFTYQKIGNKVQFSPVTTDISGNDFYWEFGEYTAASRQMSPQDDFYETNNSPFPLIALPPGEHRVSLMVRRKNCGISEQVIKYVSIEGVDDYFPKKASTGGDFNMFIHGWKFDETAEVSLKSGSTTIMPVELSVSGEGSGLNAFFDFHLAKRGTYDVVIKVPGITEPFLFKNGLEVTSIVYPETYSEIVGSDIWRTTNEGFLGLMVYNKGSVTASGVVAALIWPEDIEVVFNDGILGSSPKTGSESVQIDGETFTLPRSDYMFIYDSLNKPTPIDTFNTKPYKGFIKYILIPHVPASGHVELPFTAHSKSGTSGKIKFHTYTFKTNQKGSCENPVYSNFNENLTAELIDGMDMVIDQTNVVPLKVLSKTAKIGQKHAGSMSSYFGKKFWAWYDGYEFDSDGAMRDWLSETEANNAFALQTATDELGSLVFNKASAKMLDRYKGQVDFINKRLAANPNMSAELTEKYLNKLNSLPHDQMRRFEALKGVFDNVKNLGTLSDKLVKLQKLVDDCPELAEQLEDLIKDLEKELNIRDEKEKESELSNSYDPNMITGPSGVGTNRYLTNTDFQTFTISFENLETATAAAQVVRIYDTLDVNKYDLSTFSFGSIGIGNKYFRLPPARKEFAIERNIEQEIPVKVRISGSLDESTGIVSWLFVAIDTTTNNLPVLEGFLPPNINGSEGQGFVRFTVKPKHDLSDGTIFENSASIIFDENDPIETNEWRNILDIGKPTSGITAQVADTTIRLNLSGFDAVSGMGYYNLYVKVNDGEWIPFGGTSADSLLLVGQPDSTYSFYVRSRDKVGNEEEKIEGAEATVTIQKVLAVTFGSLTAQRIDESANRLQWNTYQEDRDDYFVIERSEDGASFADIGRVNANGRPSLYEFRDANPVNGNNYYRIKIINNDGRITYSNIAVVKSGAQSRISVFPNPVSNKLTVRLTGVIHPGARLILYNAHGQKVAEQSVSGNPVQIDMQRLPAGMYHLVYKNGREKDEIFKIVKE